MTSVGELFPKCRKLLYDARQNLSSIQRQNQGGAGGVSISDLNSILEELNRQLDCMDALVLREIPEKRQRRKLEIEDIRQESARLYQQGRTAAAYQQRRMATTNHRQDREELMLRRRHRRQGGGESDMQNLADEAQSLEQSNLMVNGLLSQGEASLTNLKKQRGSLLRVQNMLLDIGSRLGLTQSVMRIIERRDITDAYLVFGGMVVTCLVIYFVWF